MSRPANVDQEAPADGSPSQRELVRDLKAVRSAGIGKLRTLGVSSLRQVAVQLDLCDKESQEPAPIVDLLRRAVGGLGGGDLQDEAEVLLGLAPGMALATPGQRVTAAAAIRGLQPDTYRKRPQEELLEYLAELVLALCHDIGMRRTRVDLEARRHPADSRLAVQWVERFEAYYAIWSIADGLANDLEAALQTYLEEPADHLPWDPNSEEGFDPVAEARGYARSALYHYAAFLLEVRRFRSRYGGLWLASDEEVEAQIADAAFRIGWHNDINDEDDSWLRRHLADARREENDHFIDLILAFPRGVKLHNQWQAFVRQGVGLDDAAERERSQVRLAVAACRDYCRLVDEDWLRIADWYRPEARPQRRVKPTDLYDQVLRSVEGLR